jgi:protein-L-isoaspartate O-methyltransferase
LNARIALLGFSIECNRWAPVAILRDFETRCLLRGADIVADARAASPSALGEMPGFVTTMDAAGPWTPCPIMLAMAEPNGPVDQTVFDGFMAEWRAGLEALRGACDGVYAVLHGAGLTTGLSDPEAALQALVREILGDVPFICGYDLHGNISAENVALNDAFVGYRTNPHVDMRPRGAEAAQLMLRMLAGERFIRAHRRLPIMAPTVSMLTAQGPYAEVINLGQARAAETPSIANVSVMGGFAYGDTPFNGMTIVVTGTEPQAAETLADELAQACWERRGRFVARLTAIPDALAGLAASPLPLAFADVDIPLGHGQTMLAPKIEARILQAVQVRKADTVLEVGAGTGTNFAYYPDTVSAVVALEPETRLAPKAREAAAGAAVPVTVVESTIESMPATEPFDAVVCSLVLCSVDDPDSVLRQLNSVLKPGGELRYFEHVASAGWRGGMQRLADVTLWPRIAGNCHTHRHTERAIRSAGFSVETVGHLWTFPRWVPIPISEVAVGRVVKQA